MAEKTSTNLLLERLTSKALEDPEFSAEDVKTLQKVAKVYRGIEALGFLARVVTAFAAGLSTLLALWSTFHNKMPKWLP